MNPTIVERRMEGRRTRGGQRRRYPRVRLGFEGFYDSDTRSLTGSGRDLTLRGAFLDTPAPDPRGTRAIVRLMIPNSVSLLKLEGEVIHANADPASGPVGMGIRFSGVEPWQLKRLAALLLSRAGYPGLSDRPAQPS